MRQSDNDAQVFAEIGRGENPNDDPECRSNRINQREAPPGHPQYSCQYAVELAQDAEEPGEQHRGIAVADICTFDPAETFLGEADLCAVAQDNASSELSTDQIT